MIDPATIGATGAFPTVERALDASAGRYADRVEAQPMEARRPVGPAMVVRPAPYRIRGTIGTAPVVPTAGMK